MGDLMGRHLLYKRGIPVEKMVRVRMTATGVVNEYPASLASCMVDQGIGVIVGETASLACRGEVR